MISYDKLFIGGKRVAPLSSDLIEIRSPYNNALVGSVPTASKADVDAAVQIARDSFDNGAWPLTSPVERQAVLARFIELYSARAQEFAALITKENGSPIAFGGVLAGMVVAQSNAYLQAAAAYPWEVRQPAIPQGEAVWRREPLGVVAAVIPWNAPHQSALVKLFPSLLAGCTVILKLAPETALDGQVFGELFAEAGLPEGVLSIFAADREVSEYLVSHPGVDKVAFTGSTAAGRRIASIGGAQLKRVSLELGGKSAAIVLPDANQTAVIEGLPWSAFPNNGQSCVAHTRILVQRDQHDAFVSALAEKIGSLKIGDPLDPEVFFGPQVSERQRERVASYIELGIAEGATLALGGTGLPEGGCTPESQKFPSAQLQSRHERIQVDELAVSLEGVMPVQQDVPPGRWRHLRDQRQRLGIASCLVLRQQQGQDRRVVEDDRVADQPGALVADLDFDVGAAGQFLLPTDLGDGRA